MLFIHPGGQSFLSFTLKWAVSVISRGDLLPRYVPNKILIDDIHRAFKHLPESDTTRIAKATFIDKALKLDFNFKFSARVEVITHEGSAIKVAVRAKNLPTLIFVDGKEFFPKGLPEFGTWKGKEYIYTFTKDGSFKISDR